ncbi:hypothetical protein GA0116948_11057 [Chitinophaga costaii]|uniref:Uncharacterized protein n=1 Tax=Chitinophaga costaii TaxID=1335309 RepID=A0A1C4EW28_9BACT|nr:hypothetical protein [Chitinophaga costaii]PUZ21601.1 hypothetical protein DCM91_16340 [Chitinophaga costaii]SCC47899.1 hypothetical protein GA0116948_11057 [Chitinophaga costaii]
MQLLIDRIAQERAHRRDAFIRHEQAHGSSALSSKRNQRDELHFLDTLAAVYAVPRNEDERLSLNKVKDDRKALERSLYPVGKYWLLPSVGTVLNLIRKVTQPARYKRLAAERTQTMAENLDTLERTFRAAGYNGLAADLRKQYAHGMEPGLLTANTLLTETKAMRMEFTMERTQGHQLIPTQYTAVIRDLKGKEPDRRQVFDFSQVGILPWNVVRNALSGRPFAVRSPDQPDGRVQWFQQDKNNLLALDTHFHLTQKLGQLAIQEARSPQQLRQLEKEIMQGGVVDVTQLDGTKLLLEMGKDLKSFKLSPVTINSVKGVSVNVQQELIEKRELLRGMVAQTKVSSTEQTISREPEIEF